MSSKPSVKTVRLSTVLGGDTRLEASTYLREGYGFVRLANQCSEHVRLGDLAEIWQPSRLTGYTVPEGKGLPFLTAGQVFEDFPRVRKWLAKPFIPHVESRYVDSDWLLLSCSGVVGKVTAVYPHHLGKVITHDLLRVVPKSQDDYGWLYAYMKTGFFRQIAQAAQYGHMIKHIEVGHAAEFPVIMPEDDVRTHIGNMAVEAIRLRSRSWELRDKAFTMLEKDMDDRGFDAARCSTSHHSAVNLASVIQNRMRLDANCYTDRIGAIEQTIDSGDWDTIGSVTTFCSDLSRFSRTFGDGGIPYVSASELFDVNATPTKKIYEKLVANWQDYVLHPGMIVMACSGQRYGILGRAVKLTDNHEGLFGSHDLMRIIVDENRMRSGYLLTYLNDPQFGRPYVVRNAYGTSIPHLDSSDVRKLRVPRLNSVSECAIADTMDESVAISAHADLLENTAVHLAQEQINDSIAAIM
jgi:hypothetical protein